MIQIITIKKWLRWEKKRNQFFQHDERSNTESPTMGCCQLLNLLDHSWFLIRWPKPNGWIKQVSCCSLSEVVVHRKTERIGSKRSFLFEKETIFESGFALIGLWVSEITDMKLSFATYKSKFSITCGSVQITCYIVREWFFFFFLFFSIHIV